MPADSQAQPPPQRAESDPVLARQLRSILLGMIGVFMAGAALLTISLPQAAPRWLAFAAVMSGLCLGCLLLSRLGRARASAILFVCGLFAITTGMAATSGGVPSPGTMAYLAILPMTAILLGRRAAAMSGAATAVCILGLLMAGHAGWLPTPPVSHTPLTVSIILGSFLAALLLAHKSVFDTVAQARRDTAESAARSREADAAVHKSEQRLSFALEAVNDGLFDLNLATGEAYCSPRYLTMLGYGPTELPPSLETWRSLLHPDDLPTALEQVQRYATGEIDRHEFEVRMRTRDGSWRWILSRGRLAERTADGRPLRLIGTHVDVTERRAAEAALRETEQRLRMIVEHSTNLFFLHTPDNQLRYVSPQSLPMIGYRPEEAMRNWTELLTDHPANAIGIQRTEQALRTGQPQPHYELQLRTKSGRLIWVEVREAPVVVNGETVAIAGSLTDITARVAAEAAARASDQRLRSIADHAPFGAHIYTLTADDRLILEGANHPADRILHIDHRTLFGKDIEEAFPGLKGTDIPTTYRRIAREGGPVHFEQVSYDKDQIQGVFDVHALQSGPGRMIVFFSDITEQRRSEAALRASEERFRSLFNAGNDAVFVHRLADRGSGRFTEVNDVACRMLGYTREELGTLGPAGIHAPDAAQILDTAFDRLDRDRHALFESTLVTKSRERLPVEISARVFDFAQVPTVISVVRDIAERKRLEEQLRHSQKMEVFGQLASGVAHDFNNLLVVINGNTEMLLQERGLDAALREPVEQVHEAGTRAAALTRQLLLFSRRQKPQTQQADLAVIVGNLVKLLRRVIGEHINLNLEFAPTPLPVLVDVNMIEQVLMNLAVNARDAMPRGGLLTIRTHTGTLAEPEAARLGCRPGPYAVLRVRDNGSGIPPEIQPKIFDPFFTTKETGKGTGLGLSTVLAILQQHEGGIAFTSEPDKGTEFTAYLPLAGAPSGLADPDAAKAAVAAVGRKATILLVEDEEGVRRTAARVLRVHGLTVEEARSGREALERLPSLAGRIDLVLSDIVMPGGVDGLALAREIARRWPELPVVLMTGYTRDTEQVDRPLLHKPFTIDSLMEAVRSALSSAPGRS